MRSYGCQPASRQAQAAQCRPSPAPGAGPGAQLAGAAPARGRCTLSTPNSPARCWAGSPGRPHRLPSRTCCRTLTPPAWTLPCRLPPCRPAARAGREQAAAALPEQPAVPQARQRWPGQPRPAALMLRPGGRRPPEACKPARWLPACLLTVRRHSLPGGPPCLPRLQRVARGQRVLQADPAHRGRPGERSWRDGRAGGSFGSHRACGKSMGMQSTLGCWAARQGGMAAPPMPQGCRRRQFAGCQRSLACLSLLGQLCWDGCGAWRPCPGKRAYLRELGRASRRGLCALRPAPPAEGQGRVL